jgi:hypothetical protein
MKKDIYISHGPGKTENQTAVRRGIIVHLDRPLKTCHATMFAN